MKISNLKQPYRRMAEYLAEKNTYTRFKNKEILNDAFDWYQTNVIFWLDIADGDYPPITEEIKKHFPADFDFSGEKYSICYAYNENDLSNDFKISYKKNYDYTMEEFYKAKKRVEEKEKHTQLAREGKFDQLPDTCEFSEAVELEVWDFESVKDNRMIVGKFKNLFMAVTKIDNEDYRIFKYAKLPTPKIDFSKFKSGDVVEVELVHDETRIGWFDFTNQTHLYIRILQRKGNQICNGGSCAGTKIINKEKIKSITKIK